MDRKNTIFIGVLVSVAILAFLFIFLRSFMGGTPQETANFPEPAGIPLDMIISATHAYRNGEHLIAGTVLLPTPCHLLEHTVTIAPDQSRATIAFSRAFAGGECPGGEVSQPFLVRFSAPEGIAIRATLDGKEVTLSLREAGPEENLENTEVFQKG